MFYFYWNQFQKFLNFVGLCYFIISLHHSHFISQRGHNYFLVFLVVEMFGRSLGTGDYGHLTIEHVLMLFRIHRLLYQLSNRGFEAAHKLQRQLYAKATSHDAMDQTASCKYCNFHSHTIMLHLFCLFTCHIYNS